MSDPQPEDELTAELARAAVAQVKPQELGIFRPTSTAYFADPERAFHHRSKDEMLGFGVESVAVLTPYALAIAKTVVLYLMAEVTKQATERSRDAALRLVRRLFRRDDQQSLPDEGEPEMPTLSHEQLVRIRDVALGRARELDLDEEKATLLADAMVGSLVLESG